MVDSRPATAAEARARMGAGGERGLYLGRFVDEEAGKLGDKLVYGGESHALVFGPTGCGKGVRFLAVNLLGDYLAGRSVIVLDPKGELAAVTAKARHEMHGPGSVKILDPFGKLAEAVKGSPAHDYLRKHGLIESVGFNPLVSLKPGSANFYDDAAGLAEGLITIDKSDRDKHWPESAQALAIGFLMWAKFWKGEEANLEDVRTLLTGGNLASVVKTVLEYAGAAEFSSKGGEDIQSLLGRFAESTTEIANIRSTADTQTRWILSKRMREDLKKPGVDFSELKEKPQTVYVILPAERMRTHSVWLRLVIVSALRALYRPGGLRTVMLIDEMAALGRLRPLEDAFGLVRGYRLQIVGIFQDLAQLKADYDERWESFVANAGVVMGFPPNDKTTSEWMSWRSGQKTDVTRSLNQGPGRDGELDISEGQRTFGRPFYWPHDLIGMHEGSGVLWLAGLAHTVRFFADKYSKLAAYDSRALRNPYWEG
jgi:type IV secretion system protein VirD4